MASLLEEGTSTAPAQQTQEPEVNPGSAPTPDFLSTIPDAYRTEPSLQSFKSQEDLLKSYVNAQKAIGSMVRIPTEGASQEHLKEFYSKLDKIPGIMRKPDPNDIEATNQFYAQLGRPDSPDKYSFAKEPDPTLDPALKSSFAELAHKSGLSDAQAKGVVEWYKGLEQNISVREELQKAQTTQLLKETWGDDYTNRFSAASIAFRQYSEKYPEAAKDLVNGPAGNNPILLMMAAELGKTFMESGHITGQSNKTQFGLSATEAQAKIQEVLNNRDHPYHKGPSHPGYQRAFEEMALLYQKADSIYSKEGR